MTTAAYPLSWPPGWPREKYRGDSRFKINRDKAVKELEMEISRLGGSDPILSTNLKRNLGGGFHGNQPEPADPGVAVYFTRKGKQMVFACDKYRYVTANITAVARTIEALRGIERWGASDMMERAFTGFEALPPPSHWTSILGLKPSASEEQINAAFRERARTAHPDAGGSTAAMAALNAAREAAIKERAA